MKRRILSLFFSVGLGWGVAGGMDLNTLVERSPFSPPGAAVAAEESATPAQLEFRGIAADGSGTLFSIYDLAANRGYWVREGEAGAVTVKSFDPVENQVLVEQGGRTVPLKLKRATIQAGAPIPVAAGGVVNAAAPGGGQVAGPAADAKRLEAVAAEVRRRRALRNAATQPAPAAVPAPAPAAVPATPPTP